MKNFTIALAFLTALSLPVSAQDFQKGLAAYDAGDYATALQEFRPLAGLGHADAQFILASMYLNGQGVPNDPQEVIYWYCKAEAQRDAITQAIMMRGSVIMTHCPISILPIGMPPINTADTPEARAEPTD
jgi:TPR repeat protein